MQSFIPFELLAYFDPGSGSLLIQMLVGGSAGLFVFAKYLWNSAMNGLRVRKLQSQDPARKMIAGAGSQRDRVAGAGAQRSPGGWTDMPTVEQAP